MYADIEIPEGGSFDDMVALKGSKNIGEEMDKIIAKLAEENDLRGVIDNAHFNDVTKLWINVNKVDSKKRKNYTDISNASFWLGVRPLLCE